MKNNPNAIFIWLTILFILSLVYALHLRYEDKQAMQYCQGKGYSEETCFHILHN